MKNRDLIFRAWDTKNKCYIEHVPAKEYMLDAEEWDHHDIDEAGGIYPLHMFSHYAFSSDDGKKDRIIFEQYTGIKDKNGKKIFEGDIIKVHRYWMKPVIKDNAIVDYEWMDKEIEPAVVFWGWNQGKFLIEYRRYDDIEDMPVIDNRIELIGNVNQNPELNPIPSC